MANPDAPGNRKERLQWFNEIGFGLFIHWSLDGQIGSVIGHSMAMASEEYLDKYTQVLPSMFNPKRFDPDEWAALAKLAGIRYVVFTTKHHNGFCMFHTESTAFNISNTPFQRDITGEIAQAFRQQGIAVGWYHSPDDFHFLRKKGMPLRRGVKPQQCDGLLEHNQMQMKELLTNYGKIDIVFFDGPSDGLRELCWEIDPDIVVTRGAIKTPEQHIPGVESEESWEACVTMGTGWQYKPTNEVYKSGTQMIELLIETRAKGGNLLLNVGPKPDGQLPIEQEGILREFALWNFVNDEAIHGVRPWRVPFEGDVWFTKKGEDTVYALVKCDEPWAHRDRRELSLCSVKATETTEVQLLGQAPKAMYAEHPAVEWTQDGNRLQIRATRMQRLYNNRRWPNPIVFKITNAQLGIVPPAVTTRKALWDPASSRCQFEANLVDLESGEEVEVGFEYRLRKLLTDASEEWRETAFDRTQSTGEFSAQSGELGKDTTYEFRAVARHRDITVYGDQVAFRAN